jgi:hypothetical protein
MLNGRCHLLFQEENESVFSQSSEAVQQQQKQQQQQLQQQQQQRKGTNNKHQRPGQFIFNCVI